MPHAARGQAGLASEHARQSPRRVGVVLVPGFARPDFGCDTQPRCRRPSRASPGKRPPASPTGEAKTPRARAPTLKRIDALYPLALSPATADHRTAARVHKKGDHGDKGLGPVARPLSPCCAERARYRPWAKRHARRGRPWLIGGLRTTRHLARGAAEWAGAAALALAASGLNGTNFVFVGLPAARRAERTIAHWSWRA